MNLDIHYFTPKELLTSSTAIQKNVSNIIDDWRVFENLPKLAWHLEKIRGLFGEPIIVSSAYRNSKVNKLVGGVNTSFHLFGRAADLHTPNLTKLTRVIKEYCHFTKSVPAVKDGKIIFEDSSYEVIIYPTFIHFAFKN